MIQNYYDKQYMIVIVIWTTMLITLLSIISQHYGEELHIQGLSISDSTTTLDIQSNINVINPLIVMINGSSSNGQVPISVNFTSQVQGGISPYVYTWNFGDNQTSSFSANTQHNYSNTGIYTVQLVVTDAAGRFSQSNPLKINISQSSPIILQKGWDPTFSIARIATKYPTQESYFESCPDAPSGKCYGVLSPYSGFWTLSIQDGPNLQPCKVNTLEQYDTRGGLMQCPYSFSWKSGGAGHPLTAWIGINNTDWFSSGGYNIYEGITEAYQSIIYSGSSTSHSIHTNNGTTTVTLQAFHSVNRVTDPNANARYEIGMVWSSPSMGKAVVIEINVGDIPNLTGYIQDTWNQKLKIGYAADDALEPGALYRVELGGAGWGYPDLTTSIFPVTYTIHWNDIIRELVKENALPTSVLNDNGSFFTEIGTEQHGRMDNHMLISNYHSYEIFQNNLLYDVLISSIPLSQPLTGNSTIPEFGHTTFLILMIVMIFMIGITKIRHVAKLILP